MCAVITVIGSSTYTAKEEKKEIITTVAIYQNIVITINDLLMMAIFKKEDRFNYYLSFFHAKKEDSHEQTRTQSSLQPYH